MMIWSMGPQVELPPRARRIHSHHHLAVSTAGTTSACAENTAISIRISLNQWNYLRVRGEYPVMRFCYRAWLELPPRARRIHQGTGTIRHRRGTTSACAENTNHQKPHTCYHRNYLRVRGEYCAMRRVSWLRVELPPRARRILIFDCATSFAAGNYLRVRGEYTRGIVQRATQSELPPRARRILSDSSDQPRGLGTTSACAENTGDSFSYRRTIGNYLRVRGEYL